MTLLLTWVDSSERPRARVLSGTILVGRDAGSAGLVLEGPAVAGLHAAIDAERRPPVVSVVSPEAALFVNGLLVRTSPLADGDRIAFGDVEARVLVAARVAETAGEKTPRKEAAPVSVPSPAPTSVLTSSFPLRKVVALVALLAAAAGGIYAVRGVKWHARLDPSYIKTEEGLRERLDKEIADREKAEKTAQAAEARAAEETRRAADATRRSVLDVEALADRVKRETKVGTAASAAPAAPGGASSDGPLETALRSVVAITGRAGSLRVVGSGFFVTDEGHVLTNAHVVEVRAAVYEIHVRDGGRFAAQVQAVDTNADLAVLKIQDARGEKMPALVFGAARQLHIGDTVFAAGTPLSSDLGFSVTRGIVSADLRSFGGIRLVQHDASINPGNSGGPLLDAAGRVVGINTLKITGASGLGFAIPIEVAEELLRLWRVRS